MRRKLPLSLRILLGLGLGVLAGLALQDAPEFAAAWIQPFGTLFLNLVKMLVVPLVFCSLTAGWAVWGRPAHGPGRRPHPPVLLVHHRAGGGPGPAGGQPVSGGAGAGLSAPRRPGGGPSFSLADTLLGIVPTNPIQALAEGNMLQILFLPWPSGGRP